jgi:S-layer homology domain
MAPQRRANRRLMLPLAGVMLLQPFITPRAVSAAPTNQNTTPANQPAAAPVPSPNTAQRTRTEAMNAPMSQRPVSVIVDQYYDDANRIPQYAVDEVAQATRAGIVINYPNIRQLNPQQPATRGEIAAIIYQVLANKGQVPPLASTTSASRYIVNAPNTNVSNQAQ